MLLRLCLITAVMAAVLSAQGRGGTALGAAGRPVTPQKSDCAASGTVVNSVTGEPIPRATVTLGGGDMSGSSTDAQGRWSIANTLCGARVPDARRAGFISTESAPVPGGKSRLVQLVSGTPVTDVKITLAPEAAISGQVDDANGDPVESAQIRIYRSAVQAGKRTMVVGGAALTDSKGEFRTGQLTPGRYLVCAESPQLTYPTGGGEPLVYRDACYPGPLESGASVAMPVEAGREVRTMVTLTAVRGAHVRGSVSGLSGRAGDTPAGMVQLTRKQGGSMSGGGRGGPVMPDGTFDLGAVAPGTYQVRAGGRQGQPGVQTFAVAEIVVDAADVNNLALAMPVQTQGSISGSVRYELVDPKPAAGTLNVDVGLAQAMQPFGPVPPAKWDAAHQTFEIAPVSITQYRVNASLNRGANGASGPAYIKSVLLHGQDIRGVPISVEGALGPIEIVVGNEYGSADLNVTDAEGHAVAAAVMLLSASGQRTQLNAGEDGLVNAAKMLPVGEYRAWAFESFQVPYAEEDWMNRFAGPGEKFAVTASGSVSATLKRVSAAVE